MESRKNNFNDLKVNELLIKHFNELTAVSPYDRGHVLDINGLKDPNILFWSFWENNSYLIGCGAIKFIDKKNGEFKSIRVSNSFRGKGYGIKIIQDLIYKAKKLNLKKISLETGKDNFFSPARKLFLKYGFKICPPFAHYKEDDDACYMNLKI